MNRWWDVFAVRANLPDSEPLSSPSSYICIIKRLMAPANRVLLSTCKAVTVLVASADGSRCGNGSVFALPAGTGAGLRAVFVFSVLEKAALRLSFWRRIGPMEWEPAPTAQPWAGKKWSRRLFFSRCSTDSVAVREWSGGRCVMSFGRWGSRLEHKWNKWLWKGFYWFSVQFIHQDSFVILGQINTLF